MTNYFAQDPYMVRAMDIGGMAGILCSGADYWGQHAAGSFLMDTQIYVPSGSSYATTVPTTQPSLTTDPSNSLFPPAASNNLSDLTNIDSYLPTVSSNLTGGNSNNANAAMTLMEQFMDLMMNFFNLMTQGFNADSSNNTNNAWGNNGLQDGGAHTDGQCPVHGQAGLGSSNAIMDFIESMLQGWDMDSMNIPGFNKTEVGTKEEVADARQDKVDSLLEKRTTQRKFDKFTDKLESGNKKDINKALKDLAKLPEAEFAAFVQYLGEQGKDLAAILETVEQIDGVSTVKIDKVIAKEDEAIAWLEADDIEESDGTKCPVCSGEAGKDRDEVADIRQERVDSLLEKRTTQRQFERVATDLESTDKKELNEILKELSKMPKEKLIAFQQYLEDQGKDLATILEAAKQVDGVKERTIDKIEDKYADSQDWLEALDIED